MSLKKYYNSPQGYILDHKNYFSNSRLKTEAEFITKSLSLKKKDKILDLACGQGRHTITLSKKGYNVSGVDFSEYLLNLAKEKTKKEDLKIDFYKKDVHNLNFINKFDKIFLFFSDFGALKAEKVLEKVYKSLKKKGLFLLDCDNVFRLVDYLKKHPDSPYYFDFEKLKLNYKDKGKEYKINYYTASDLKKLFKKNGLQPCRIYGDYKGNKLNINSKRIIVIGKKF